MTRIDELSGMETAELRMAWEEDLGRPPPTRASDAYMRSVLAYRIQEWAGPKLSAATVRHLERLVAPNARIEAMPMQARKLSAGTSLLREWNGETHEVRVLESGFEYRGRRHRSLSGIAREITGTRWSGPAFFGLKDRDRENSA
ncbi:MAG: DUF2924 domain-containing protein [Rhodospirillales bacterium]|nr:DUF2924 domain-containing protein [Rhodospirillales bacterium]